MSPLQYTRFFSTRHDSIFDRKQACKGYFLGEIGHTSSHPLESADIDCDVTSLDGQQEILPGVGGTVILVRTKCGDGAATDRGSSMRTWSTSPTAFVALASPEQML
jgi:hypothetical protein